MTEKKSDEKAAAPKAARPKKASQDVDALVAEVAAAAKTAPVKAAPAPKAAAAAKAVKTIRIVQLKSGICTPVDHKLTLKALGLRRIRHEVVRPDTPSTRGLIRKVRHLVAVVGE